MLQVPRSKWSWCASAKILHPVELKCGHIAFSFNAFREWINNVNTVGQIIVYLECYSYKRVLNCYIVLGIIRLTWKAKIN